MEQQVFARYVSIEYLPCVRISDGSNLTAAALLRHDATFGVGSKLTSADIEAGLGHGDGSAKDVTEMTHKTFDTFASDWSGCTNVAFEKVLMKFKASRAGDKVWLLKMKVNL